MGSLLGESLFWKLALSLAAPCCFWFGFRWWRRARLIEDTPLSRVRSAAQGYVELHGRGKLLASGGIAAPLSGRPCVWWQFRIERKISTSKGTTWETVNRGVSELPFLLEDETGSCMVNPAGAEVVPSDQSTWMGRTAWPVDTGGASLGALQSEYRYTEHRIYEHERLAVLGEFFTVGGVTAIDADAAAAELLRDWKRDQPELLKRFDANGDGVLSQAEWETARAAARQQIVLHPPQPAQRRNIVMRPDDGRPLLIAACDAQALARRYRWRAAALLLAFVAISGLAAAQWLD